MEWIVEAESLTDFIDHGRYTIHTEPLIRCRDCKHRGEKPISDGRYWCDIHDAFMYYCSDAERRTDD